MNRSIVIRALGAAVLSVACAFPARPALADGAASTRNIILGGAVAGAGTLIWLNHNKKVHEKYAEYDRRQAATQERENEAEGAYASEEQAYAHEAALVAEYRQTIAYQHHQVVARDREIGSLRHSLTVAKYGSSRSVAASGSSPASVDRRERTRRSAAPSNEVTYGWGSY